MGSLETPCENCGELVKKQRESQRRALLCPYAAVNGRIGLDGLVPARLSPACLHAGQPSQTREVPSVPGSALRSGLLGTPSAVLLMCHPVPFSEVSQRLSFCLRTRGRLRFCLQETFRSSKATVLTAQSGFNVVGHLSRFPCTSLVATQDSNCSVEGKSAGVEIPMWRYLLSCRNRPFPMAGQVQRERN